eukprot:TRINITY_DN10736_c0_g1_i1.p2 TRINITY_DN10736_c0_g1~~TRINITY_DN10736_c0_g1_i1.p2  ORF type:complete len:174 (-),score=21.33 TRINITY_DN10736_c0_g1_i1:33-554(-)
MTLSLTQKCLSRSDEIPTPHEAPCTCNLCKYRSSCCASDRLMLWLVVPSSAGCGDAAPLIHLLPGKECCRAAFAAPSLFRSSKGSGSRSGSGSGSGLLLLTLLLFLLLPLLLLLLLFLLLGSLGTLETQIVLVCLNLPLSEMVLIASDGKSRQLRGCASVGCRICVAASRQMQ